MWKPKTPPGCHFNRFEANFTLDGVISMPFTIIECSRLSFGSERGKNRAKIQKNLRFLRFARTLVESFFCVLWALLAPPAISPTTKLQSPAFFTSTHRSGRRFAPSRPCLDVLNGPSDVHLPALRNALAPNAQKLRRHAFSCSTPRAIC